MVGDGILNATLHSPVPLNDNEWHFVQAELNVKLARIKVDYQPWAVKRFPPQTFITMKFTHPLIVGRFPEVYLEISKYKNDTNEINLMCPLATDTSVLCHRFSQSYLETFLGLPSRVADEWRASRFRGESKRRTGHKEELYWTVS